MTEHVRRACCRKMCLRYFYGGRVNMISNIASKSGAGASSCRHTLHVPGNSQFCLSGLSGGVALQPHLYEPSVSTNNSAPSYVFKTSSSLHQILYLAWNLERGGEDNWGQSRNHVWATPPEQGRVTWGVQPFRDCSHSLSANSD